MAIHLPDGLPARHVLEAEGIVPARHMRTRGWQPRPLEIAVLNLMPNKPATEVQMVRLLASGPFDVRVTLLVPDGYRPHSTPAEHLSRFYLPWSAVRHRQFDGLIVTGAPVETIPCEEVAYWRQLTEILDWTKQHVRRTYYICWGAMAALFHFHGIRTPVLSEKRFGVFEQTVRNPASPYLRGFTGTFPVPVSRRAQLSAADLPDDAALQVLADSPETGLCLLEEPRRGALYMFNHLEYEATTLREEYFRDLRAGQPISIPKTYFSGDDLTAEPVNRWRPFAQLLCVNWLSEICDAVLPHRDSERSLDWLLSEPTSRRDPGHFTDFLIVVDDAPCLLPAILQAIETAGHRSLAAKAHRPASGAGLVEVRVAEISAIAAEQLAKHLLHAPGVRQVAHRDRRGLERIHLTRSCSEASVHWPSGSANHLRSRVPAGLTH